MEKCLPPEKAEVIGLLCAEGSHFNYKTDYNEYDKKRGKFYRRKRILERIEFTNLDNKLLQHFQELLQKTYSYSPNVTGIISNLKVRLAKKNIIKDLLKYTDFGCLKWSVPREIINGTYVGKIAFIRGYFLGDGCFSNTKKGPVIKLTSVNRKGIFQVSNILTDLKIEHKIYSYNPARPRKRVYQLMIRKKKMIECFKKLIFNDAGLAKADILNDICGNGTALAC